MIREFKCIECLEKGADRRSRFQDSNGFIFGFTYSPSVLRFCVGKIYIFDIKDSLYKEFENGGKK